MHETPRGRTASNGAGQVSRRGLLVGSGLVLGGAATGVLSPARARAGTGSFPDGAGTTAGTEVPAVDVRPGDLRYPALTTGYNQRFSGTPAYVAVVTTPEQCLAAVREAVAAGRRVTVRGGGHCYEGFVSDNPGGAVIDLSGMRAVAQDQDGGVALQAGCTNWDVYELLYKSYGVTLPGGSCYSVGLGGHVVGGGYGLMSREHGLTVDYLDAVDVIVVDANRRVRAV
ncbi:MAG TPA: FAD-binding protein, partial [Blastococcus sp.]